MTDDANTNAKDSFVSNERASINRRDLLKVAGATGVLGSIGAAAASSGQGGNADWDCDFDCEQADSGPDLCAPCFGDAVAFIEQYEIEEPDDEHCWEVDGDDIPENATHVAIKAATYCQIHEVTGGDQEFCIEGERCPAISHLEFFAAPRFCGKKFLDEALDGDSEQEGLEGWTIELVDEDGDVVTSTETDAEGQYCLTDPALELGMYTVREVLQEDWIQTYPEDDEYELEVEEAGDQFDDLDFGNVQTGSIEGYKVEGEDPPAEVPPEHGLEGWTIELYDDSDEEPIQVTTTREDGWFGFDELLPGEYTVREVVEDGWIQMYPTPEDDGEHVIDLGSGESFDTAHFANVEEAGIEGYKFEGEEPPEDPSEYGLEGWTIELYEDLEADPIADTVTDESGWYGFDGLAPGEYYVAEVLQDGWAQMYPEDGVHEIELASGDLADEAHFGNVEDEVDEQEEEEAPFTIGYWRNHSMCTPGNQDPVLQETLDAAGGITLGDLTLTGSEDDCPAAVNILSKRDIDGNNMASDGAYGMAAQLLAALLNVQLGVASIDEIGEAEDLLDELEFDGTGSYLPPREDGRQEAIELAEALDAFNNGE